MPLFVKRRIIEENLTAPSCVAIIQSLHAAKVHYHHKLGDASQRIHSHMKKHLLILSACLLLAATTAHAQITLSIPNNLSATPGTPVNVPFFISNGAGITDIIFSLTFDATRLVTTGTSVNSTLSGATFTLIGAGAGTASLSFHDTVAFSSGTVQLGLLLSSVPNAAPFGSTTVHFSTLSINGGALSGTPVDGVVAVVPEPSTYVLLGLGSLGFLLWRRTKRGHSTFRFLAGPLA
jgi:hypothetical protein